MFSCQTYESPLGRLILSSDGTALTGLSFADRWDGPACTQGQAAAALFDETRRWLDIYFSGRDPGFTPPLAPAGSAFQRLVWQWLLQIPFGETRTYGQIAAAVATLQGRACMSAQAIGGAVSPNPIVLIIPCHRVVAAGGAIGGFSAGLDRKRALLSLESVRLQ